MICALPPLVVSNGVWDSFIVHEVEKTWMLKGWVVVVVVVVLIAVVTTWNSKPVSYSIYLLNWLNGAEDRASALADSEVF